jgi:DNA-binding CsgD family transcriptional regulator
MDNVSVQDLSRREKEVLIHFSDGLTYVQIGRRMGISRSTVDTYLRRIRVKTGATIGAELIRLGMRLRETGKSP